MTQDKSGRKDNDQDLQRETINDALPLPSPSSAPHAVTDTEEIRNPAQMIRSAVLPAVIV